MPYISDEVETLLARGALTDYAYCEVGQENACPQLPVLIANGIHDVFIDAADSFAMARRPKNAITIFCSDAGHGLLFQHPEAFAREVLNFLSAEVSGEDRCRGGQVAEKGIGRG